LYLIRTCLTLSTDLNAAPIRDRSLVISLSDAGLLQLLQPASGACGASGAVGAGGACWPESWFEACPKLDRLGARIWPDSDRILALRARQISCGRHSLTGLEPCT